MFSKFDQRRRTRGSVAVALLLLGANVDAQDLEAKRRAAKAAAAARAAEVLPASSTALFDRAVIYVKDVYADPARIHPARMLPGAIEGIAKAAPELQLDLSEQGAIRVVAGGASRRFDVSHVDSLSKLSVWFHDLHRELVGPLGVSDASCRLGFGAVNGMLSTLDPFSVLVSEGAVQQLGALTTGPGAPPPDFLASALAPGIGYVRLRTLAPHSSGDVELAVNELAQKRSGPLSGLVLDLRGNTGGLLEQAVRLTNSFVADGLILTAISQGGRFRDPMRATPANMGIDAPLVVLTDERTSAGAEIVAAALKDLERALIVGRRTAGMGTVQTAYQLGTMEGLGRTFLLLTSAILVRPSGKPIDRVGLVPDVRVLRRGPGEDAGTEDQPALRRSVTNPFASRFLPLAETKEQPEVEISYDWRAPPSRPSLQEQLLEDFEIRLASDILQRAGAPRRSEMLPRVRAMFAERR